MKLLLYTAVFITFVSPQFAQNLILSPGCEDSLINGEIPEWAEFSGTDWQNRETGNPPSLEGNNMFFAGASQYAELQQDVDVSGFESTIDSGKQYFYFEGYVRSYSQSPADHSRLILKYLNNLKTMVLDSIDLGENSNTDEWLLLTDTTLAPIGSRFIKICLISIRYNGTNNDGYFDGLSLTGASPVDVESYSEVISGDFNLFQNYPNPFNPSTKICYRIGSPQFIQLKVLDVLGNEAAVLINEYKTAGSYETEFSPAACIKNPASGIYFYQLKAGEFFQTKKMVYIK